MFDISFIELVVIGIVALVVLGPERLPGAVRTAGLWIGRLKRSFNSIKRDIEKEIGADEIRRQLRNEEIMSRFDNTKEQFTKTIDSVKSTTDSVKDDLDLKKQFDAVTGAGQSTEQSEAKVKKEETSSAPTKNNQPPSNNAIVAEENNTTEASTSSATTEKVDQTVDPKPSEQK